MTTLLGGTTMFPLLNRKNNYLNLHSQIVTFAKKKLFLQIVYLKNK